MLPGSSTSSGGYVGGSESPIAPQIAPSFLRPKAVFDGVRTLFFLALVFGACSTEPRVLGDKCSASSDCDAPLVCRLERCRVECVNVRDCPFGLTCLRDQHGNASCEVESEAGCVTDADCPASLACDGGECTNRCGSTMPCAGGLICRSSLVCADTEDGPCGPACTGMDCTVCGDDQRCESASCRRECLEDEGCRSGSSCHDGLCVRDPSTADAGVHGCDGASEGTGCPGGLCRDGACCTGCWDGVQCLTDNPTACGIGGGQCAYCDIRTEECAADGLCQPTIRVTQIAAASWHTCVLDEEGVVWCWGDNEVGQLGLGHRISQDVPMRVAPGYRKVAVGGNTSGKHSCAITTAGTLHCWGDNSGGQLGNGMAAPGLQVLAPDPVHDEGGQLAAADWAEVELGDGFSCGLRGRVGDNGGSIWCWGEKSPSENATGAYPRRVSPPGVNGWHGLSVGYAHACAILDAGDILHCWGRDDQPRVPIARTKDDLTTPGVIDLDPTNVRMVAALRWHACAITNPGALRCWGENRNGQLHTGDTLPRPLPVEVPGQQAWLDVSVGSQHTCAIDTGRSLYCWGGNSIGQLGLGLDAVDTDQLTAQPVMPEKSNWDQIVSGNAHQCGVDQRGALWCWGSDWRGRLGRANPPDEEEAEPGRVWLVP